LTTPKTPSKTSFLTKMEEKMKVTTCKKCGSNKIVKNGT
jgi:hypothetical protein